MSYKYALAFFIGLITVVVVGIIEKNQEKNNSPYNPSSSTGLVIARISGIVFMFGAAIGFFISIWRGWKNNSSTEDIELQYLTTAAPPSSPITPPGTGDKTHFTRAATGQLGMSDNAIQELI